MKKLLLPLILLIILTNVYYSQQNPNIILGEIIETEGEYVFIDADKDKEVVVGMIFGIYSLENEAIGICEINKINKKGNYIARVLTQTEEIKKGYTALADVEREFKLREKIKGLKAAGSYLDSYKKFEASVNKPADMTSSDVPSLKDAALRKIYRKSLQYLGIEISKFSNPFMSEKEEVEIIPLNIYRDIIDESGKLKIDRVGNKVYVETTINIGKLKRRLQNKGYAFKPKIIRLVFPPEENAETVKQVLEKILKYSNFVAKETEDMQDVTSPVSCIIYTTPKIFAEEINTFNSEEIGISVTKVYEDTIELKIW